MERISKIKTKREPLGKKLSYRISLYPTCKFRFQFTKILNKKLRSLKAENVW